MGAPHGAEQPGTIPLPKPLWFDQQGDELGSRSIVMDMIDGESLVSHRPPGDESEHLGMALQHVPRSAASGPRLRHAGPPEHSRSRPRGTTTSTAASRTGRTRSRPTSTRPVHALIASWLRANKPPPAPLTPGARRLPDRQHPHRRGRHYMVDWELAHVGDPREDLGWMMFASVTPAARRHRRGRGGLLRPLPGAHGASEEQSTRRRSTTSSCSPPPRSSSP